MEKVKQQLKGTRSYGQFCALARSLDVVGDRWTLLIVRELLPSPMRYTELKASLAGIATNLLAQRLRTLETQGIIERRLDGKGVSYALTSWGAELREPMEALGRWGAPLLASGPGEDAFQPRWLTLALPALLRGITAAPAQELGIEVDGFMMVLRIDETGPQVHLPSDQRPATVLTAPAEVVVGLAVGEITVDQALSRGAELDGDKRTLREMFAPRGSKHR